MMRCFLPCFGSSKRQKHLRSAIANPSGEGQTHVAEGAVEAAIQPTQPRTAVEESIDWITESKIETNRAEAKSTEEVTKENIEVTEEEPGKAATVEKTAHQAQQVGEKKDNHEEVVEEECSESLFSLSLGSGKLVSAAQNADTEVNSPMQLTRKEVSGSTPIAPERLQHQVENLPQEEQSEKEAKMENTKVLEEQPNVNELIKQLEENKEENGKARLLNHPLREYRYRDCSDEGYEDINLDDADLDDDQAEYSSESLFSLSTDYRKRISSTEKEDNEVVSSVMPAHITQEESQGNNILEVSSVLNPIENLTQGKVLKPTLLQQPLKNNNKENINLVVMQDVDIPISPEPSLRISKSNRNVRQKMKEEKEIGIDTSLSSWLVESETTPKSINSTNSVGEYTPKGGRGSSPFSNEDRPILGALTLEEIRKYSMSAASSKRSRSRSPDETPIIGTVGSYWSHTGQRSMSSKFNNSTGKDVKLNWSSSTVKTRLEPAFEASVAET